MPRTVALPPSIAGRGRPSARRFARPSPPTSGRPRVVERARLDAVLGEQTLQARTEVDVSRTVAAQAGRRHAHRHRRLPARRRRRAADRALRRRAERRRRRQRQGRRRRRFLALQIACPGAGALGRLQRRAAREADELEVGAARRRDLDDALLGATTSAATSSAAGHHRRAAVSIAPRSRSASADSGRRRAATTGTRGRAAAPSPAQRLVAACDRVRDASNRLRHSQGEDGEDRASAAAGIAASVRRRDSRSGSFEARPARRASPIRARRNRSLMNGTALAASRERTLTRCGAAEPRICLRADLRLLR